jgi:hypothetical protein
MKIMPEVSIALLKDWQRLFYEAHSLVHDRLAEELHVAELDVKDILQTYEYVEKVPYA